MNLNKRVAAIMVIVMFSFVGGCFPTYKAIKVDTDTLSLNDYLNVQAKVFTNNNTIIAFPNGFSSKNKSVIGKGVVCKLDENNVVSTNVTIPFDSIAAMITYKETTSGARHFGSFLYGLTSPLLTTLGIYCLVCPKCCFGSCPTIYVREDGVYNLKAELFSECISRQLEDSDIDLIKQEVIDNQLSLRVTNEALETHYINKFEVIAAYHKKGTKIFPTIDNKLTLINRTFCSNKIISKDGENITEQLNTEDEKYYRSGIDKVQELKTGPVYDYVDIFLPKIPNRSTKMIIKYRNTLLSTTLLYDVVLGSQGIDGISWTNRMNEDNVYASKFKMVYDMFSGIKIKISDSNGWINVGTFKDAGPLMWKYMAVDLSLNPASENTIRLEFIPDNFMIDNICFDTTYAQNTRIEILKINPTDIHGLDNERFLEITKCLEKEDDTYLKTEPGDNYTFSYSIPSKKNMTESIFIYSGGYYNEWIRGSWIRDEEKEYTFDLYDIRGTLSYLADSWIKNSDILEKEFFNSRVILWEKK